MCTKLRLIPELGLHILHISLSAFFFSSIRIGRHSHGVVRFSLFLETSSLCLIRGINEEIKWGDELVLIDIEEDIHRGKFLPSFLSVWKVAMCT